MQYIALEMFEHSGELVGIRAIYDDLSKPYLDREGFEAWGNDTVELCRKFFNWAKEYFPYASDGRLEIVAFGIIEPTIFQYLIMWHIRIRLIGGVLNPHLLERSFNPGTPLTCEEIITILRKSKAKPRAKK